MDLILWRHAEAEDTTPDMSRVLTPKGRTQAKLVADWLKLHMPANTQILVSPAMRTQQTAIALGMDFTTVDELAPGSSPSTLLEIAQWRKVRHSTLIIGHQPTLGMAAALAITSKPHYWCVKKGALWWITSRTRMDEQQTILRTIISPEFL